MKYNIRKLMKTDFEKYITLISQLRPIEIIPTREKFEEIYDTIFTNNMIFIAEEHVTKKLIGSITLLIEQKFIHNLSKYARIEDVVVDENYRKQNIGRSLVKYAICYAKKIKVFKITLTCKKNLENFYKKNDFEIYDIHMSQLL